MMPTLLRRCTIMRPRARFGVVTANLLSTGAAPSATVAAVSATVAAHGAARHPAAPTTPTLSHDLALVDLRVGLITRAWPHPESQKLWCEDVDLGQRQQDGATVTRPIASGLRGAYAVGELAGRRVVVVANLPPRPMAGFVSHGMLLCASENVEGGRVELLEPPLGAALGERLTFAGLSGSSTESPEAGAPPPPPLPLLDKKRKKVYERVAAHLCVDGEGRAVCGSALLLTSAGPCVARTLRNVPVS
jgi:methionine--tRNA ligase beta chain